ncbi:MAG: hypothetical protein ACOYNL_10845 [Rickettsiales bacterium]
MSDEKPAKSEKKKKKENTSGNTGKKRMRFKHKFVLIVFSIVMMGLLRTGFVFFVIGMLPCIVAYYMDVSKYRYTFKSVFAANLSGMMPYITKIIYHGPSSTLLQEIMGDSTTWIIIYGAALLGWMLVKVCPMVAQAMVAGVHQTQFMRYDWLQKKLENEWGDEVKQFSGDPNAEH